MHKSASAPCLGMPGDVWKLGAKGAPASADEGLSRLLDNHGLGGHAPELCARLGVSNLWHLSLLSYQHIETSGLPPVVKGFLTGLLFHPSHLTAVIDKKYWSSDLAKHAAAAQYQSQLNAQSSETRRVQPAPEGIPQEAHVDAGQTICAEEQSQDLWGKAVPGLMQRAKSNYAEKDYAGALKN
jgi:hypothetical protein